AGCAGSLLALREIWLEDGAGRYAQAARRGASARMATRHRDERRDQGTGDTAMGRVRDTILVLRKRLPGWLQGREGDAWFMLIVLIIGLVSVVGLQGVANAMSAPPRTSTPHQQPAPANLPQGVVQAHEQ